MPRPTGNPQELRAKRLIMAGFFVFVAMLLGCFLTVRFIYGGGEAPPNAVLFVFAGGAICSVLMEMVGVVMLVRAARRK